MPLFPLKKSFCQRMQIYCFNGNKKFFPEINNYLCDVFKIMGSILSFLLSIPVWIYRYSISPLLRPSCRHVPSCSQYMLDALKMHGPFRGLIMGIGRILRCRPGGTHGYDPVPVIIIRKYKAPGSGKWKKENRLKHI